jgi:hypothetical protein
MVTFLGEPTKTADEIFHREQVSKQISAAIAGLEPSLKGIAEQTLEHVMNASDRLDRESLIEYIEKSSGGEIGKDTVITLFSALAASSALTEYRD